MRKPALDFAPCFQTFIYTPLGHSLSWTVPAVIWESLNHLSDPCWALFSDLIPSLSCAGELHTALPGWPHRCRVERKHHHAPPKAAHQINTQCTSKTSSWRCVGHNSHGKKSRVLFFVIKVCCQAKQPPSDSKLTPDAVVMDRWVQDSPHRICLGTRAWDTCSTATSGRNCPLQHPQREKYGSRVGKNKSSLEVSSLLFPEVG